MAGKGCLEKRGVNTWRLVFSNGMKGDKQIKKKKSVTVKVACEEKTCRNCTRTARCHARREAEKLLAEFVVEIEKGLFIEPTKLSFSDFVVRWTRDYAEKNLAPKTLHRYRQMLNSRILPAMGHLKIEKISPIHLLDFYSNLQEEGIREDGRPGTLSERTILHHHRLISAILQDATEWQIIKLNPAFRVKPPKVTKKPGAYYDEEQTAALLAAADKESIKHKTLIYLAIATGARAGELMGLEWKDIDFDKVQLMIRQVSQYLPGKGIFTKEPKNETSIRTIGVPLSVITLLKQYKKHQAEERLKVGDLWKGSDRVFTTWDGRPGHPGWPSQWFPKFLARTIIHKPCNKVIGNKTLCPHCEKDVREGDVIKLPPLPFHGLRHTAATLMIGQGSPLKNVSSRLGHSNISTTSDIYGHALKSVDRDIADKLDTIFSVSR